MRDASDDPDEQQLCDALGSSTVMHTGGMIQESVRRGTRPRVLAWGMLYPGPRKYLGYNIVCTPVVLPLAR